MEAAIVPPRAQIRFLHDILRVMLVAHEMTRERVCIVEQGHDDLLEGLERAVRHGRLDPGR